MGFLLFKIITNKLKFGKGLNVPSNLIQNLPFRCLLRALNANYEHANLLIGQRKRNLAEQSSRDVGVMMLCFW